MAEQNTPVLDPTPTSTPAVQPSGKTPEKRKKNKKLIKNIVIAVVIAAALAAAGWLIYRFVFADKKNANLGEPIYDQVYTGSISSAVKGGGTTNAKDSSTITLSQGGMVQEVFVTQGQMVQKGDPLYVISSAAAEEALATAKESLRKQQEAMQQLQKDMSDLQKSRNDLTITAPHAGKLTEVASIKTGDPLSSGTKIAVVVDDTRLKLSLYYSYAYENAISVGQRAEISIPATMTTLSGKVETINKVRRIVPEGAVTFEVIFVMDNPGTLTSGMAASASLTDGSGNAIYPYESGSLAYYQTTTVATKAQGPVTKVTDLLNYANVSAGQVLVVQGTNTVDEQIRAKQEQITAAQKSLDDAVKKVDTEQKNLANFSAVAPIAGTVAVLAPNMVVGQKVDSGLAAITISDNSVMTVNINVDDRNRQYIKEGMIIQLSDWNGNSYEGTVESVAVQGTNQNGVTVFPAVVRVDNPTGTLMAGYGLDYNFTAAQSENVLVVPVQDVRYYTPEGAKQPQAVVYLQTSTPPENAIDKTTLPAEMQDAIPKDCFVVPVETGLNDDTNVEIKSGLNEGDMVYNNTPAAANNGGGAVMMG